MALPVIGTARTESDLFSIVRAVRDAHPDKLLLFRGQTALHDKIQSGRARGRRVVREVEVAWSRLAARMIGAAPSDAPEARFAQAILQHYGLPTYFVDLTADPGVAAWFAGYRFHADIMMWAGSDMRSFQQVRYQRVADGEGHVLVLGIPDHEKLEVGGHLFCLQSLPREVLRPHRQLGWLFFDGDGGAYDLNGFCLGTIAIDRSAYSADRFSQAWLFPSPKNDVAYQSLLGFPWVQVPTIYFPSPEAGPPTADEEEQRRSTERWCFARRALETLEYFDDRGAYDHKWDDVTLYEPHPVRAWKGWHFDLGSRFPQWQGDIANAVKITLSERARELLETAPETAPFSWPDVGSNDIFFSFSQIGHDKVLDYGPPYRGVWLHRSDNWVVETVTEADEDVLTLGPGLAYVLARDGTLKAESVEGCCTCGNPDSHVRRVSAMLRLSHFVDSGDITFVPHPLFVPGWYVAV